MLEPNFSFNLVKYHIYILICTAHTIYSGEQIENNEISGTCGTLGDRGIYWGNLRERDYLEDPCMEGKIILRWISLKRNVGAWTGSITLSLGTGNRHL